MSSRARSQITVPLAAMSVRFSGSQHGAAGHRDHDGRHAAHAAAERPGLGVPERRLAVAGEELGHGQPGLRLHFGIGIEVVPPELPAVSCPTVVLPAPIMPTSRIRSGH